MVLSRELLYSQIQYTISSCHPTDMRDPKHSQVRGPLELTGIHEAPQQSLSHILYTSVRMQ